MLSRAALSLNFRRQSSHSAHRRTSMSMSTRTRTGPVTSTIFQSKSSCPTSSKSPFIKSATTLRFTSTAPNQQVGTNTSTNPTASIGASAGTGSGSSQQFVNTNQLLGIMTAGLLVLNINTINGMSNNNVLCDEERDQQQKDEDSSEDKEETANISSTSTSTTTTTTATKNNEEVNINELDSSNSDTKINEEEQITSEEENGNANEDVDVVVAGDESELNGKDNGNNNIDNETEKQMIPLSEQQTKGDEHENKEDIDLYPDNPPEEDEDTSCVICLINRQGPCRPSWRKFEKCMKANSDNNANNETNDSSKSNLAEQCDKFMIPWIGCIQNYRNTYTLISNDFFQKELVDEIERYVDDDERVFLDNIDISSIVQISDGWWSHVDISSADSSDSNSNSSSTVTDVTTDVANNNDDGGEADSDTVEAKEELEERAYDKMNNPVLVDGVARINLFDGDRPVEIAYVKDQDGTLLGYDQFTEFKKSIKESNSKDENDGENGTDNSSSSSSTSSPTIGQCNFHVSPETTKSIQIYALYRSLTGKKSQNVESSDVDTPTTTPTASSTVESDNQTEKSNQMEQTLYVSSPVLMRDLPKPSEKDDKVTSEESVGSD